MIRLAFREAPDLPVYLLHQQIHRLNPETIGGYVSDIMSHCQVFCLKSLPSNMESPR